MSRIGNRKLIIPAGVTVTQEGNTLTVKGPKGQLKETFDKLIKITVSGNEITCEKLSDTKYGRSIHGTTNALINNMIIGVSEGFQKELETVGVGYRFATSGNKVTVNAGYSNPVIVDIPEGINVTSPSNTELVIEGIDKQKITEFAANIRKIRKPEPYKGKGIRYKGEFVRRKEGKKAAK
ncbi:MAG: 50S ribosomal protein L6 [Bacilli bacterium]|nr:50S ribosomal protein L6 [Bacilli bacterium]MDD4795718.1 50S ribosomal protein L6 [Bacilli bacterium]